MPKIQTLLSMAAIATIAGTAIAQPIYINEVYFDPPGSTGDIYYEYIELRGNPNQSLSNHYLIFIENEDNPSFNGSTGTVEAIFNLSNFTIGTNGFLVIRQKNPTTSQYTVAPGTMDIVNTGSSAGFGHGAGSSFGALFQQTNGRIENSGFTAMLVKTDGTPGNAPTMGLDLDVGINNGLDHPTGRAGWTITDSVGVHSENGEANYGRLYAPVNFGPEASTNIEPGASYTSVGFEIEYIARWGSSTGQTANDWHVSNLTDDSRSGFTNNGDWRQSADPHVTGTPESSWGVPYGTNLTGSLGRPNYPIPDGDLNQDFVVDQLDLNIVLSRWGVDDQSLLGYWLAGDSSGDGVVAQEDLNFVLANWGRGALPHTLTLFAEPDFGSFDLSLVSLDAYQGVVPEPASLSLLLVAAGAMLRRRRTN